MAVTRRLMTRDPENIERVKQFAKDRKHKCIKERYPVYAWKCLKWTSGRSLRGRRIEHDLKEHIDRRGF